MIKINPPRAYPELDGGPQLHHVKVAREGLRGTDFASFVKQASHALASWVRENPPLPGEEYVCARAMGAAEFVGQNRNADSYGLAMLRSDIPTFEKHAFWFQNHKNSNPRQSYGKVKKAHLSEATGMVDTITALNATKQAADRNGNLVAERTLQKMASGIDVAVSQSCRVSHDVCTSCGNKAPNRAHYCGPAQCKYGGCRDNLGRSFDDGFCLGVDNPVCDFFDLSDVSDTRGADRTAFITGKVAASGRIMGGAELAEQLNLVPPDFILDPAVRSAGAMLRKMAAGTRTNLYTSAPWDTIVLSRAPVGQVLEVTGSDAQRHQKVAELSALGVVLPPDIWLSTVSGADATKCASVFAGGIDPDRDLEPRPDRVDLLLEYAIPKSNGGSHWLTPTSAAHVKETRQVVLGAGAKRASYDPAPAPVRAEAKARYLAYQAGILAAHEDSRDFGLLLSECLRHNRLHNDC